MPPSPPAPVPSPTQHASRIARLQARIEWVAALTRSWRWLWPPAAFAAGLGSFFLVDRQQWLGGLLVLAMLLTWLLLLSENLISRWLSRRDYPTLPRWVTTFIAQMVHQETLFFCLPFLLATTVWVSGQAFFTLLIIGLAGLSILDPLYYKLAEKWRWLYFAFHAQCVFVVMLITLPTLLHLTTGQSLKLALLVMLVISVPSLIRLVRPQDGWQWLMMAGLLALLATLAWSGRVWVPAASLWITETALSPSFEEATRSPQGRIRLTPQALQAQGLYAYTAIRAPRGLREEVVHEWRHDGEIIDRIALTIDGGRESGYRAWSHKENFPEATAGDWRIDVLTDSGQRIGVMRFTVSEEASQATLANGRLARPVGLPGLDFRALLPDPGDGGKATRD